MSASDPSAASESSRPPATIEEFKRRFVEEHLRWKYLPMITLNTALFDFMFSFAAAASLLAISRFFDVEEEVTREKYNFDPVVFAVYGILIAPILETLILQWAVIELTRRLGFSVTVQFFASMGLFCLTHFSNNILSGLVAGAIGGTVLTGTYLIWRMRNDWIAFWATVAVHFWSNSISIGLGALAEGLKDV